MFMNINKNVMGWATLDSKGERNLHICGFDSKNERLVLVQSNKNMKSRWLKIQWDEKGFFVKADGDKHYFLHYIKDGE
jgi:hypothetical protein